MDRKLECLLSLLAVLLIAAGSVCFIIYGILHNIWMLVVGGVGLIATIIAAFLAKDEKKKIR